MAPSGDRRRLGGVVLAALVAGLALAALASLAIGPSSVRMASVPGLLFQAASAHGRPLSLDQIVVYNIRGPRTVLAILVGAALAVSGAMLQSLFRNPLADPGLIGVSSGASLGAVVAIVLGGLAGPLVAPYLVPAMAFLGGLVATAMLYGVATREGRTSVASMLLAGVALAALSGALTSFMVFLADDTQLRNITFWLLGGLGGATWPKIGLAIPVIGLTLAASLWLARDLDRLVLGEAAARHLGAPVERVKQAIFLLTALGVGVSVSLSGVIGFVGVVVPQLLRLAIGPEHHRLLPASACLGAILLLLGDIVCRTVASPAEVPLGIITALIGAPFFLFILLRRRGVLDL